MRNGNISHLYSPRKRLENPSVLQKITERCLTGWSRSHATALPGVTCLSVTAPGVRYTAASANGLMTVSLIIPSGYSPLRPNFMSFYWMPQSSRPTSTVQVQKKEAPNETGHSRRHLWLSCLSDAWWRTAKWHQYRHTSAGAYKYKKKQYAWNGSCNTWHNIHWNFKRTVVMAARIWLTISIKMVGNQLSRPKEEPSLSVIVTGSCIKNAIWQRNTFSIWRDSAALPSVMINWRSPIWDSCALLQSWYG